MDTQRRTQTGRELFLLTRASDSARSPIAPRLATSSCSICVDTTGATLQLCKRLRILSRCLKTYNACQSGISMGLSAGTAGDLDRSQLQKFCPDMTSDSSDCVL